MILRKWNYKKRKYEKFNSPVEFPILILPLEAKFLSKKILCTNCGEPVLYGDCYTSKTIHNWIGLGYPVCEECYREECIDEMEKDKLSEENI